MLLKQWLGILIIIHCTSGMFGRVVLVTEDSILDETTVSLLKEGNNTRKDEGNIDTDSMVDTRINQEKSKFNVDQNDLPNHPPNLSNDTGLEFSIRKVKDNDNHQEHFIKTTAAFQSPPDSDYSDYNNGEAVILTTEALESHQDSKARKNPPNLMRDAAAMTADNTAEYILRNPVKQKVTIPSHVKDSRQLLPHLTSHFQRDSGNKEDKSGLSAVVTLPSNGEEVGPNMESISVELSTTSNLEFNESDRTPMDIEVAHSQNKVISLTSSSPLMERIKDNAFNIPTRKQPLETMVSQVQDSLEETTEALSSVMHTPKKALVLSGDKQSTLKTLHAKNSDKPGQRSTSPLPLQTLPDGTTPMASRVLTPKEMQTEPGALTDKAKTLASTVHTDANMHSTIRTETPLEPTSVAPSEIFVTIVPGKWTTGLPLISSSKKQYKSTLGMIYPIIPTLPTTRKPSTTTVATTSVKKSTSTTTVSNIKHTTTVTMLSSPKLKTYNIPNASNIGNNTPKKTEIPGSIITYIVSTPQNDFPQNHTVSGSETLSFGAKTGIAAGSIVAFWILLGPIVCLLCRIKGKAKARRERERVDSLSHALVEEMIYMELARGREKMYRTHLHNNAEIEKLNNDEVHALDPNQSVVPLSSCEDTLPKSQQKGLPPTPKSTLPLDSNSIKRYIINPNYATPPKSQSTSVIATSNRPPCCSSLPRKADSLGRKSKSGSITRHTPPNPAYYPTPPRKRDRVRDSENHDETCPLNPQNGGILNGIPSSSYNIAQSFTESTPASPRESKRYELSKTHHDTPV